MGLDSKNKKEFRAIGHNLKPVVIIAQNGLTENVGNEIDRALRDHELIKVKLQVPDRESKRQLIEEICSTFSAECVQAVGHIALLYRQNKKPDPKKSNLARNK
ncbi:MAG: ribosome assembly RNA-binding protein YhbY [Gammaproteobacteria bacterium]